MPAENKRPERRHRSLASFTLSLISPYVSAGAVVAAHGAFPCLACGGKGWNYKEEDCDVIEGYKLAPRHKCGACGGNGVGTKEAVKALYDAAVAKFRDALAAWKESQKHRKSGLAKLTKAEKEALGV